MKDVEFTLEALPALTDARSRESGGKGYPSRMNAILRQAMLNAK